MHDTASSIRGQEHPRRKAASVITPYARAASDRLPPHKCGAT